VSIIDEQWVASDNPYLSGQYEPVRDERNDDALEVVGDLPAALRGAYMRNGGNQFFNPPGKYHVFDGDGMVHGIHLDGEGGASYANRWVRSKGLEYERKVGHAVFGGLSEFSFPEPEAMEAAGMFKNTANTNIVRHGGRHLALMEGGRPTELSGDLETLGEFDFDGALRGAMTAHPRMDAATGEMLFFGYSPLEPHLRFHVASASGDLVRSTEVPIGRPAMIHDFVTTANHVIWFDMPALFDVEAMMAGGNSIVWRPEQGARIGVMPRDGEGSDTTWIAIDPFYAFHFMNASEDPSGRIVVDGCRSAAMPTAFGDEPLPEKHIRPYLWRWEIDASAGVVKDSQLDDRPGDFPRINDAFNGLPYRFGTQGHTGAWTSDEGVEFDGVIQFDHHNGTSAEYVYGPTKVSGEPVFAADPDGSAENDGWIINFVTDKTDNSSEFVVLDARDITAGPVASVKLPRRVPFGFHGNWMPADG